MRNVFSRVALFICFAVPCHAEGNLLRNGPLAEWGDAGPVGWRVGSREQRVSLDRANCPDGVSQALRIDILKAHGSRLGEVEQKVRVVPGSRYTVTAALRGTVRGSAFVQVKLYKGRKELDRISTPSNRGTEWLAMRQTIACGDADTLGVVLRWKQDTAHVGQSVWFAGVGLEDAGELVYMGPETLPQAVPTFNSIGLYWRPTGGSPKKTCTVQYRARGDAKWRDALPLWFDPNEHTDPEPGRTHEYRGSIVHLQPATTYEVRLALQGTELQRTLSVTTWDEAFKISRRVSLPAGLSDTHTIREGGSEAAGYVLYEAASDDDAWDVAGKQDCNLKVEASWVIVRGLTLRGAAVNGIVLGNVNHVVIDRCDVSGWGRSEDDGWGANLNSAIYSKARQLSHIVVQHCDLHHPRSDSNSWMQNRKKYDSFHPIGPQGICFRGGLGQFVIRHNRIHSDLSHMFNDAMGEVHNFSYDGFPNRDSDIHDNFVSHCWDDGLEIEGANMNVRVWHNYIDTTFGGIGAACPSLGPVYFWRNVYGVSRKSEGEDWNSLRGHFLVKLGTESARWARGKMYIFHNVSLQPPFPNDEEGRTRGAGSGLVFTSTRKHAENITSRNNILHLRDPKGWSVRDARKTPNNDWDYDLYNGQVMAREGAERHGIKGSPVYEREPGGRLWLKPGTAGHDAGVRIPNFNDDFLGAAPDMGAVETGTKTARPSTWPAFPPPAP